MTSRSATWQKGSPRSLSRCIWHVDDTPQTVWNNHSNADSTAISVQVIVSTTCKSAGEALREIDVKDMIKSDFVLVSGDVVSNMDLGSAVRAHRARREKNKNALMTMVRFSFSILSLLLVCGSVLQ